MRRGSVCGRVFLSFLEPGLKSVMDAQGFIPKLHTAHHLWVLPDAEEDSEVWQPTGSGALPETSPQKEKHQRGNEAAYGSDEGQARRQCTEGCIQAGKSRGEKEALRP